MATVRTAGAPRGSRPGGGKAAAGPPVTRAAADRAAAPAGELCQRDPDYLARWLPWFARYSSYFSSEVRGLDNLPADGPVLVVANHSGHYALADACLLMQSIAARRGVARPAYTITYGAFFKLPWIGQFMRRIGCLPQDMRGADAALDSGALVLVFPGGDWDAERPWTFRNRIDFMGHRGFVKLALRHGVPVVPAVTHGAHQAVIVVSRGERIARALHLGAIHFHALGFVLGPPWGISPLPMMVLPSKVTLEFLPAIDWSSHGAGAAGDEEVLQACYDEITGKMQLALDHLSWDRPHPITQGTMSLTGKLVSAPFRTGGTPLLARPAAILRCQAKILGRQAGWLHSQGTRIASHGRQLITPPGTKPGPQHHAPAQRTDDSGAELSDPPVTDGRRARPATAR